MNEQAYISRLEYCLSALPERERQEILDDYRRHFRDGRAAGETDEQIIARLGMPDDVAAEYFEGYEPPYEQREPRPQGRTPRWAKLVIGGAALFWLFSVIVAGIGYTGMRSLSRNVPIPAALEIHATTMSSVEAIIVSAEVDEALRGIWERFGETYVMSPGIEALEELARVDWSFWAPGPKAEMEPVSFVGEYRDVEHISVKCEYDMSVSFVANPGIDAIRVTVSGSRPTQHDVWIELQAGTLTVEYRSGGQHVNLQGNSLLYVEIAIPDGWRGNADVYTWSGRIFQETGTGFNTLDVGTMSGSIWLDGENGIVLVSSISGSVQISGGVNYLAASAISGDVGLWLARRPVKLSVSTVSGNIDVFMDGEYEFTHSSVSGSLMNGGGGVHTRGAEYSFSTVSGDVRLCPY